MGAGHSSEDKSELEVLRDQFDGNVVLPEDPSFAQACETWHKNPLLKDPRRPRLVLQPRGTQDVVLAVKYARKAGLDLSVKCGGHSPNNACLSHDGLTVDLGLMRGVYVDPAAKTAVAEGGCRLGDVDSETSLHNLGVPLGHAPVTGMGLVLNGGIGVAGKMFGPASDHILELTVVTAEGAVLIVSQETHPELFWAMRGVGSAFGIVTKLKLRLHDVSDCLGGAIMVPYSREHLQSAARWLLHTGWLKPEFCATLVITTPPGAPAPLIAFMMMYFGKESKEQKLAFVEPLRKLPVVMDTFGQMSYYQTQCLLKPMVSHHVPNRHEYATSGGFGVGQVTEKLLDRVVDEIIDKIPPFLSGSVYTLDWWASDAIKQSKAPLGFKSKEVAMLMLADWYDSKHTDEGIAFAKYCRETLASMHTDDGIYANADLISKDMVTESGVARRVGGPENLKRLREVKLQYDPDNMFRNHHFTGLMDSDQAL